MILIIQTQTQKDKTKMLTPQQKTKDKEGEEAGDHRMTCPVSDRHIRFHVQESSHELDIASRSSLVQQGLLEALQNERQVTSTNHTKINP